MADGGDLCEEIWVDDLLQKILKISMEHVVINCLTDEKRKQELLSSNHMEVRVGDAFGMNCLADSLLQC